MAKPNPKAPAPLSDLGPMAAAKLQQARQALAELEADVGSVALDKALEKPGAAERLAELNGKLAAARNDVDPSEAAYRLAVQRDAKAHAERTPRAGGSNWPR